MKRVRRLLGGLGCGLVGHVWGSSTHTIYPTPDGLGWMASSTRCVLCGHAKTSWVPYP